MFFLGWKVARAEFYFSRCKVVKVDIFRSTIYRRCLSPFVPDGAARNVRVWQKIKI